MYGVADEWDEDDSALPLIQGYAPTVYRTDAGGRGRDFRRQGVGDNRSSGGAQDGTQDNY